MGSRGPEAAGAFLSRLIVAASLVTLVPPICGAQTLLEEVRTLSSAAPAVERPFDVPNAGAYEMRLLDNTFPAAFVSLRLIITRGAQIVATADAPGATAVPFNTVAGSHVVHVVGAPNATARAGSFAVEIAATGATTPLLQFAEVISLPAPPNPNQLRLETTFTVTDAGSHHLVLSDLALPVQLSSLLLNILGPDGNSVFVPPATPPAAAGTFSFNATAGEHDLFVIAEAPASAAAGLVGVRISGGPNAATVYDQAHAVGSLNEPVAFNLSVGAHTLRTIDFNFPASLSQLSAVVMRGGTSLARRNTAGSEPFTATAGPADLFVLASPTGNSAGTYALEVATGSNLDYQDVRTANQPNSAAAPGFTYIVDIATAGSYRITLTDFQFPASLQTLALNASQSGSILGTLNAAGAPLDITAAAGRVFISVIAQPPSPATSSLFGLQVTPSGGAAPLLSVTQGVGELFVSRTVAVATAGRYDVTLTDLDFPVTFADLALAVTRGSTRVGNIFGGGTFSFDATPGDYAINFIATPNSTQKAGTYGLRVSPTPPAPTVTLAANPASVPNGSTTMLTWNSSNATACTASGAWSGSKATSGSQPSGALTSSSTFTLTCTGAGGNANQSVTVTIAPPSSRGGGGGGWTGIPALCALLTVLATRRREARYA